MNAVVQSADLWESGLLTLCIAFLAKDEVTNLGVNLTIKTPHFLTFFLNIESPILPDIFLIGLVIHPPKLRYDRFII